MVPAIIEGSAQVAELALAWSSRGGCPAPLLERERERERERKREREGEREPHVPEKVV